MQYCYVENGEIKQWLPRRPKEFKNASGLQHSSDNELREKGLYPVIEIKPNINRLTHQYGIRTNTVNATNVSITWAINPLDQSDIDLRIAAKKAEHINAIKLAAKNRILAFIPDWKQSNYNARMNELNKKKALHLQDPINNPDWDAQDQSDADNMQLVWDAAKAIRIKSDVLELAIDGYDATQLSAFNAADDSHWN